MPAEQIADLTSASGRNWDMDRNFVAAAAGMVSVQAGCTPDDALVLITARAEKCGSDVEDIAKAVVDRRVRFDKPSND